MRLAILANTEQKEEILSLGIADDCTIYWLRAPDEIFKVSAADVLFDLLFEENKFDTSELQGFLPKPVIVNSVTKTLEETGISVIRINGWPGFLKRTMVEVACRDADWPIAKNTLKALNRESERIPDIKGFVSPRVISMIINEAYFALEENVSTKDEIDTAMKLGTNYPYGPFEWSKKIGLKKIAGLLLELSTTEKRYTPSALLLNEAGL